MVAGLAFVLLEEGCGASAREEGHGLHDVAKVIHLLVQFLNGDFCAGFGLFDLGAQEDKLLVVLLLGIIQ